MDLQMVGVTAATLNILFDFDIYFPSSSCTPRDLTVFGLGLDREGPEVVSGGGGGVEGAELKGWGGHLNNTLFFFFLT